MPLLRQKLFLAEQPEATREKRPFELATAGHVASMQRMRETVQDETLLDQSSTTSTRDTSKTWKFESTTSIALLLTGAVICPHKPLTID